MIKELIEQQRIKLKISKRVLCAQLKMPVTRYNDFLAGNVDIHSQKFIELLTILKIKINYRLCIGQL